MEQLQEGEASSDVDDDGDGDSDRSNDLAARCLSLRRRLSSSKRLPPRLIAFLSPSPWCFTASHSEPVSWGRRKTLHTNGWTGLMAMPKSVEEASQFSYAQYQSTLYGTQAGYAPHYSTLCIFQPLNVPSLLWLLVTFEGFNPACVATTTNYGVSAKLPGPLAVWLLLCSQQLELQSALP